MTEGSRPLGAAYDVALLDLDGVVYIGGIPIPGAPEALQQAKRGGMRLAYVTNNASRTPAAIAGLLAGMNVPADEAERRHLRSGRGPAARRQAAAGRQGPRHRRHRAAARRQGTRPHAGVHRHRPAPQAVVQGYGPGIMYATLAEGGLAVRAGALFVGTNADSTLPGPRGIQPGNGSLLQVIAYATGTAPVIAGKPEPPLHRESVIRTNAKNPLVVGDRLDTDIEAAHRAGADSLLVLTGVSRPADVVLAPPTQRPTYIGETLDALLQPYPDVTLTDDGATCGGWTALRAEGTHGAGLALKGSGSAIDGLRALAAAAWQAGEGRTTDDIKAALKELAAAGLPT